MYIYINKFKSMNVCSDFKHISYRKTSPHNSPKLRVWLQHVDRGTNLSFSERKKKKDVFRKS